MNKVFVEDLVGNVFDGSKMEPLRPPAPPTEPNIYSRLVPVEEGQSEAWDLKVLSEANMPADLAPSDLFK